MPSQQLIDHAYPLQLITVQVQGRRDSYRADLAWLLRQLADKIEAGEVQGATEDDDFGYAFTVDSDRKASIFPDL